MIKEDVTLLTIDDETGLRHGIRDYFEDSGFTILEAENGRIGLEIFRESKPDVVLVDLRMPEVDGLEVVRTINLESPETPVIVVSGTGVLADAIEAIRQGAWDYVTKPIPDMLALEHTVERVLERAWLLTENKRYQQELEKLVEQKTTDLQASMKKLAERGEAFEHLAKALVSLSGDDIYIRIIKACAAIFKTESALLGLLSDDDTIVTSAIMVNDEILPSQSYKFKGTPCEKIVSTGYCYFREGVRKAYPAAEFLHKFAAEGYIGVCLKNRQDETIGMLGLFSKNPIDLPDHAREVLDMIASKATAAIEQERAEKAEKQLQARLAQAQKMEAIGVLAGGIAHDFNNVLAAIMGYTELAVEDAPPDSRAVNDLEKVLTAAHRAKDLVKQILAFSRQSSLDRTPVKIQPLVKESLKMLRASIPSTISITQDIDPLDGTVMADPTQIHQVIMNLCTNAYHAMENTGGELSVKVKTTPIDSLAPSDERQIPPGKYVELTVTDTGTGIGADIIDKIFEPYFTTKGTGKGSGMGLAIIHGIITSYGGAITVKSAIGQGTTFTVYLPVVEEVIRESGELKEIPGGKGRILFVDDEELLMKMGREMLEMLGYTVTSRDSSKEALETFMAAPNLFDLVITDQTMPEMTGIDLARRMLQIRPDVPIILCTGYSPLVDEESAKLIGIREFAIKPLTMASIAQLIRKTLNGAPTNSG